MVLDYNKMIEIVLEEKQDLNFEKLKDMIEEKKRKVGAGTLLTKGFIFSCSRHRSITRQNQ